MIEAVDIHASRGTWPHAHPHVLGHIDTCKRRCVSKQHDHWRPLWWTLSDLVRQGLNHTRTRGMHEEPGIGNFELLARRLCGRNCGASLIDFLYAIASQ